VGLLVQLPTQILVLHLADHILDVSPVVGRIALQCLRQAGRHVEGPHPRLIAANRRSLAAIASGRISSVYRSTRRIVV
jgi:hypothetical protein